MNDIITATHNTLKFSAKVEPILSNGELVFRLRVDLVGPKFPVNVDIYSSPYCSLRGPDHYVYEARYYKREEALEEAMELHRLFSEAAQATREHIAIPVCRIEDEFLIE